MKMINSGFPQAVREYNQVPPKPKAVENIFAIQPDPNAKLYSTMPSAEVQNNLFLATENLNTGLNVGSK